MLKNLLYFGIITVTFVISWIAFGIYHNVTSSTISSDISLKIDPIKDTFDIQTINNLRSRRVVDADLSQDFNSPIASTPPVLFFPSSPSASSSTSLNASSSGNLIPPGEEL